MSCQLHPQLIPPQRNQQPLGHLQPTQRERGEGEGGREGGREGGVSSGLGVYQQVILVLYGCSCKSIANSCDNYYE